MYYYYRFTIIDETGSAQDKYPNTHNQTKGQIPLLHHCLSQSLYSLIYSEHEEVPYSQECPLRVGEALF